MRESLVRLRVRCVRVVVCAVLLCVGGVAWGQGSGAGCDAAAAGRSGACSELGVAIANILADPAVSRAHWGVDVTAMDGAPILALHEGQFFQPASNAKLFTTAAAMALLGGRSTFETKVFATGRISAKGQLHGTLVLRGDGDANLSGRTIPYVAPALRPKAAPGAPPSVEPDTLRYLAELADQVVTAGVKSVDGDVVGDDTLFPWEPYAEDWSIDDMVWGYGAPASALTVNDNQIKVTVAPGVLPKAAAHAVGNPAAVITFDPAVPYYTVQADVVTVEAKGKTAIGIEREPGSRVLRIFGTIAADARPDVEEIAIADPAEYAATALKQMLEARGVTVRGKAVAQHRVVAETRGFVDQMRQPLPGMSGGGASSVQPCLRCNAQGMSYARAKQVAAHVSVAVAEDVVVTNKVSQNLHAELLLHQLSVARSDDVRAGSTAQGGRVVRQFLLDAGVDGEDFVFFDGSGLSGHDLVTPRATARLLLYATGQPWFADWRKSLPVGGMDGSLESRFGKSPLKEHVFAKTGTLGEARALSGYLDTASGKTVIFSVMVGNHAPRSNADRDAMDKIVAAIAAAN